MVVEAVEAVEWTNPNELPFPDVFPAFGKPEKPSPLPKLGGVFEGGFHGVMCDGRVHFFPSTLPESTVYAMITTDAQDASGLQVHEIIFPNTPLRPGDLPNNSPTK
jgi:hypothetical protein